MSSLRLLPRISILLLALGFGETIANSQPASGPAETVSDSLDGTAATSRAKLDRLLDESIEAYTAGDFVRAVRASEQLLELARRASGEQSADYAIGLIAHAQDLSALGRIAEAERLNRKALAITTDVLGEKHVATLGSLNNLADNLSALGRVSEAEPLHRKALALRMEVLGEKHSDTLSTLNSLGNDLRAIGRAGEAEALHRKALALTTEALGGKHPATLISLSNLADDLRALGLGGEAEPLNQKALALMTEVLGEKHPATLVSLNNLATNLADLGRAGEAEPLSRKALELRTEVLGEKHPDTLNSLNDLAGDLYALGRVAEAELLNRRALAVRTKLLGEKHIDTLVSLNNLGRDLIALDRASEAEPLNQRALALITEVLGEKHPATLSSLSILIQNLVALGRVAEAEPLARKALTLRTEVLGTKHPDTLSSLNNLAYVLGDLGRASEAEPLHRRALAVLTEVLGEEHPWNLGGTQNLSVSQLRQPARAHLAVVNMRKAVTVRRSRRSVEQDSSRSEEQYSRDLRASVGDYMTLADAVWAAGAGLTQEGLAAGGHHPDAAELTAQRIEAFGALQDAMAGGASQALALQAARRLAEGVGLGNLARERQQLSDEWRANDRAQIDALSASGAMAQARIKDLRRRASEIEARLAAIDVDLKAKAPDYFGFIRPEPLPLGAAQAMLRTDEAVLILVPTAFGTHVMALTRDRLEWTQAAIKADEVKALVTALRAHLDPKLGGATRYDLRAAYKLYLALVVPMKLALAGKQELFVAAAGDLASLPFGVLVTEPPTGDDGDMRTLRETHWLADSYAITQIPSLQSLAFLRTQRRGSSNRSGDFTLAGFGDPALTGSAERRGAGSRGVPTMSKLLTTERTRDGGAVANIAQLRLLPALPGTGIELKNLARALNAPMSALHLGNADTESAARKADLSNIRVLSFATHGLMAGEGGAAEPSLVFTPPATAHESDDGLLTASEVTTLHLNADWVILSACNTAAPNGEGEPGLSGLARAFFYAGGRSLLVSHWPVYDDVAPQLTVDTIRIRMEHPEDSKAQALTRAMYAIRHDPTDPSRAHPAVWAPFSLVGDNR